MARKAKDDDLPMPQPRILRAFRPGDVVFLECDRALTDKQMAHLNAEFKRLVPESKVVILQKGIRVAAREERTTNDTIDGLCDRLERIFAIASDPAIEPERRLQQIEEWAGGFAPAPPDPNAGAST